MKKKVGDQILPETAREKALAWDAIAGLSDNVTLGTAREIASAAITLRRLNTPLKNWND